MANTMVKIDGIIDDKRISTQKLLQQVYDQLDAGVKEFDVNASGQHVIGGALWDKDGGTLKFHVKNPGQRAGAMGMFAPPSPGQGGKLPISDVGIQVSRELSLLRQAMARNGGGAPDEDSGGGYQRRSGTENLADPGFGA